MANKELTIHLLAECLRRKLLTPNGKGQDETISIFMFCNNRLLAGPESKSS